MGDLVVKRLEASQKLQQNPADVEAQKLLAYVEHQVPLARTRVITTLVINQLSSSNHYLSLETIRTTEHYVSAMNTNCLPTWVRVLSRQLDFSLTLRSLACTLQAAP